MTMISRDHWAFGAQIITAAGVLVITVFAFVNQLNQEFRNEVRSDFSEMRTELAAIRTEFVLDAGRDTRHEYAPGTGRGILADIPGSVTWTWETCYKKKGGYIER